MYCDRLAKESTVVEMVWSQIAELGTGVRPMPVKAIFIGIIIRTNRI